MSGIRRDEIIYEDGWRGSSQPADIGKPPVEEEAPPTPPEKPEGSKPLLITVQLILCLIIALALFLLRSMDSGFYRDFIDFFHSELRKPVVSQSVFESADIGELLENKVTVSATPDEAAY